ncbi:MAG: Smr/MutS family protein [Candidatus Pelagibacter sp.]
MTKKLSHKDKKDWQNFLESSEKLDNKDKETLDHSDRIEKKVIDLHGFTLEEANQKVYEFIQDCYDRNVIKINIITGKGLRSKNLDDPYQSKDLSILKHSVPNYIRDNPQLMSKIIKIDQQAVDSPSKGNFEIYLKKKL